MKRVRLLGALCVGLTFLMLLGIYGCSAGPVEKELPKYSASTFYETVAIFGASFSADESRLLITTDKSGIFNVYAQSVAGGDPEQLTESSGDAQLGVSFFPEDDRFLFAADEGGNELTHLYVMEKSGTARDLTPGEKLKASFVDWSKDNSVFWVVSNERDSQHFDLYRYATETYEREMVFENTEGWSVDGISPDGRWVSLGKIRNNADSDIYLWRTDKPSAPPVQITPHEGNVTHSFMTFTPDSQELYYGTNAHGEFNQAWAYHLETQEHRPIVEADWDVVFVYFSENGRYRVTLINEDARTRVSVLDTTIGEEVELPKMPDGDISGVSFAPSESLMAFYVDSDTSPANLYILDLATNRYRRLTDSLNPAIDRSQLVEGQVVRYKSFDSLEIPAILYKPRTASPASRVPAVVAVHGGPGGQSRKGYSPTYQHLVNHGYAVLAVNNRGSSGYGKTFYHMDDKKHGEVDLKDCVWGRKYLESLDWVDGSKVGIMGGSYGGYMVAAALAFEPEAFDVGIDIFGVTNWLRTLQSIPPWWESFREALYSELGDPAQEEERLRRISPLFHASNIVKPLLVIQGANDPRVLQVESDELVEAVRANGVPVEYVIFPDEGHGFRNKENRISASDKYVEFLDRYLKGSGEAD